MKRSFWTYAIALAGVLALCSCGVTRRIPDGQYLVVKNTIKEDRESPKSERIKATELEKYIQLKPNRRFLGTNLYIQLYNAADPDTTNKNWWNRTLRKLGEAPILLDTTLVRQSAEYMNNFTVYSGYYNSKVSYSVDTSRRKARITYSVEQKEPYRIRNISYDFRDEFLRPIIQLDSANTLLHSGNVLDGNVLTAERSRITNYLKNNGYYRFTISNLEFLGDSTVGNHLVDLNVVFKQYLAGYTDKGEPIYENNSIYRISNITVNPDYDPMRTVSDPAYSANLDTSYYRGLDVLYPAGRKPKMRRSVLRHAISIYPNYLYSNELVQKTSTDLLRLGFYKNANIVFTEQEADTTSSSEVTYIGGDEETTETTTEKYMSCLITCVPTLKHSYKIELEGSTSSEYNAIAVTLGYQNRNFLRGAELFDISLRGGYEFRRKESAAFEIGGATSLSFQRFLVPFNIDRYNKAVNPRTKVEFSISSQRRPYYRRVISSATWGYNWGNGKGSSYSLRPIDLNFIKMGNVDPTFLEEMSDYMRSSYQEQIAAGISGSYVYNAQVKSGGANSFLLRFNWETAGNLLHLISSTFTKSYYDSETDRKYYEVLGIRYSQYARFDISVSNRINFGPKTNLAWRLYGGYGFSYGNSKSVPYDRFFYSGGSNSMRGWIPRTLGPGNYMPPPVEEGKKTYNNQVGNMKLEANAEMRFPVWGMLHGAVFFDVGNVWFLRENTSDNVDAVFELDRFYKQLGFNTGLGMRIDIGMAILRLDWGIRLHDPNEPKDERWIQKFKFSNTVLNFGVGYPF